MLDPFGYSPLRLAPGRDLYQPNLGPHGCLEPGGRPGAGRLNGSNGPTKLVHFITKRIFLMLDPFGYSPLRLAPGRDLYHDWNMKERVFLSNNQDGIIENYRVMQFLNVTDMLTNRVNCSGSTFNLTLF